MEPPSGLYETAAAQGRCADDLNQSIVSSRFIEKIKQTGVSKDPLERKTGTLKYSENL
jgi:hypothetical protein